MLIFAKLNTKPTSSYNAIISIYFFINCLSSFSLNNFFNPKYSNTTVSVDNILTIGLVNLLISLEIKVKRLITLPAITGKYATVTTDITSGNCFLLFLFNTYAITEYARIVNIGAIEYIFFFEHVIFEYKT